MAAVIHQVRAARPQVEVLLMSPVFGSYDPRADKLWAYDASLKLPSGRTRRHLRLAVRIRVAGAI